MFTASYGGVKWLPYYLAICVLMFWVRSDHPQLRNRTANILNKHLRSARQDVILLKVWVGSNSSKEVSHRDSSWDR